MLSGWVYVGIVGGCSEWEEVVVLKRIMWCVCVCVCVLMWEYIDIVVVVVVVVVGGIFS